MDYTKYDRDQMIGALRKKYPSLKVILFSGYKGYGYVTKDELIKIIEELKVEL